MPHHPSPGRRPPPSPSRLLAAGVTILAMYVVMGVLTLGPTSRHLEARCQPVVTRPIAHVALWPISVLALAGLPNRC